MSVCASVEEVAVELGGAPILRSVSLTCAAGEFVTLLGPSGSGKTTLLNVIAGLVPTVSGHVRFDGELIDHRPAHDRDIGIVFQSYALFPHMTVEDNIGFPLLARKVPSPSRRARVRELLELVRLEGLERRRVTSLSGGQQQRVALARALAAHPRLLLLDEPLAALDKNLRDAMQIELKRIQRETGITTIAVTHDQTEALTMADRVAIMHEGSIEQFDTPQALYRQPRNLFVSRFLGEANQFEVAEGVLRAFALPLPASQRAGTAIVRPEALAFSLGHLPGAGRLCGRVESAVFQGVRYRVVVRADGVDPIIVSVPPDRDLAAVGPGAPVTLSLDQRDAHVIGGEAAAPLERREHGETTARAVAS
jgi:putative spermidine/putrescine transport system ATP-binding protein